MSREQIEALDAEIEKLELCVTRYRELRKQRRALVAALESGAVRRDRVQKRNDKIRKAYKEMQFRRYGAVKLLAAQERLSPRQVSRIIKPLLDENRRPWEE